MRMRGVFTRRRAKAYKECISNNPRWIAVFEHEETTDALISGDSRHRKVCRADTPGPSPE